jgi:hypothetical protein
VYYELTNPSYHSGCCAVRIKNVLESFMEKTDDMHNQELELVCHDAAHDALVLDQSPVDGSKI